MDQTYNRVFHPSTLPAEQLAFKPVQHFLKVRGQGKGKAERGQRLLEGCVKGKGAWKGVFKGRVRCS